MGGLRGSLGERGSVETGLWSCYCVNHYRELLTIAHVSPGPKAIDIMISTPGLIDHIYSEKQLMLYRAVVPPDLAEEAPVVD